MKARFCLPALVVLYLVIFTRSSAFGQGPNGPASPGTPAVSASEDGAGGSPSEFQIPGPLRSFLRMAGISQQIPSDEVLPSLAWTVETMGFQGSNRPTEFLILLRRYVVQSRELAEFAGADGVIRVSNCEEVKPLLRILGYHIIGYCGEHGSSLLTANAERAFLTVDSGFPLTDLEQTIAGGKAFEYPYPSTAVPVLFAASDWTMASPKNHVESSMNLVDTILYDRPLARLYWAISKMDPETRTYLRDRVGIARLVPLGPMLDFYGSHISIRDGQVQVPGGPTTAKAWDDLVGANPDKPTDFIPKLLTKDKGWLAAYFDVLSSVSRTQQVAFTEPRRLQRFYAALRPPKGAISATTGVFRPSPWLLLLVNQVQWDENGQATVPGGLDAWREILSRKKEAFRAAGEKGKNFHVNSPDELLEAMFALSRQESESGPLQAYLAMVDLDRGRTPDHRLSPATVRLMCNKYAEFSDQYRIFSEFSALSDASISLFLNTAEQLGKLPNPARGNAFGIMQANAGIWQILARQGQITGDHLDDSWQNAIKAFSHVRSPNQLYDSGRASLAQLFFAATGKSMVTQDEIIELLAGPAQTTPEGKKIHSEIANRMRSVLDGQRLVNLDTLMALGNALNDKASGKSPDEYVFYLAGELHEFEMPQPMFSKNERQEWAARVYNSHHTDLQMKSNVGATLKAAKASSSQIEDARGQLAPFLRDTLVGLNYAYYEPPGAQALHNNPLFVRSHDFAGETVEGIKSLWQAPQLFGAGYPAGGGAHMVGSLADLPYALADLEQDFIAPRNVQALIWKELVPTLLASAVLPRWWNVSSDELHAVTLYQKAGEELLTASAADEQLRGKVMTILSDRVVPRRSEQIEQALRAGRASEIIPKMMPADTFYLTAEFARRYPQDTASWGTAGKELQQLRQDHPDEVSWKRLSQDFGVPHPTLGQTYSRELLNVPPLPAFSGYASRLLGESWDSSNLYWARLADETGHSAAALNQMVPELTRHMVENTFATDFEDWPAILRALRETGEEYRAGKIASLGGTQN